MEGDVREFLSHEFPEAEVDVDEDDGEIRYLYTDYKNYEIVQSNETFYLLKFCQNEKDDCFLEYTISPEEFLDTKEKYQDYDYRFFAVSWYNAGDSPYVNWNW